MAADTFECLVTTRKHRVYVHHRLTVHFRDVAVHARHFQRPLFAPECVFLPRKVVVAYLDVLDGSYRLKLPPVYDLLLAKSCQGRHEIFTPREDEEKSVVYLDCLHVSLL